jgi:cytochrome c biogenesis protein CcmG/thiol:disulfide interchange protein DsbE
VLTGMALPTLFVGQNAASPPTQRATSQDLPRNAPQQEPPLLQDRLSATDRAPLPDVMLGGFAGRPDVVLAAYRGRPLVVNLWATWCAPCVEEMPAFERVARAAGGRVAFLGVDVQDTPDKAEAFVRELGISYDLATDPRREFATRIGAFGMPTTLLVDPNGTIVYRHTGPLKVADLRRLLGEHLAVPV